MAAFTTWLWTFGHRVARSVAGPLPSSLPGTCRSPYPRRGSSWVYYTRAEYGCALSDLADVHAGAKQRCSLERSSLQDLLAVGAHLDFRPGTCPDAAFRPGEPNSENLDVPPGGVAAEPSPPPKKVLVRTSGYRLFARCALNFVEQSPLARRERRLAVSEVASAMGREGARSQPISGAHARRLYRQGAVRSLDRALPKVRCPRAALRATGLSAATITGNDFWSSSSIATRALA